MLPRAALQLDKGKKQGFLKFKQQQIYTRHVALDRRRQNTKNTSLSPSIPFLCKVSCSFTHTKKIISLFSKLIAKKNLKFILAMETKPHIHAKFIHNIIIMR